MNVLVVDIGGTSIKILATGQDEPRKFPSGSKLTPEQMVSGVKELAGEWQYDVVSVGYPGPVLQGRVVAEPYNLASGWTGFDFEAAFGRPVKLMNDAAMQALGSYKGGVLLFLGLGTGFGAALVTDGVVTPMELGHLSYKKGTYTDYVGQRGLKRLGRKKWQQHVESGVSRLIAALHPDDVVLGGENAKKLREIPPGCRVGDNVKAFLGGFRLWGEEGTAGQTKMTAGGPLRTTPPAWKALADHHQQVRGLHLRQLFADDPTRGERMTLEAVGLYLDYSKNRITDDTLQLLLQLAQESGLRARIDAMFRGDKINITEDRAVLHVALRAPRGTSIVVDGENVVSQVHAVLDKMVDFCNRVRSGAWQGHTGKRIRNVINIGIGGSDPRTSDGL